MVQYYNIGLVLHCRSGHLEKKTQRKTEPMLGILSSDAHAWHSVKELYSQSRGQLQL
ncbi:hypothetical protein M378DRAFT_163385 [Amanita muscaria Koide BX008]|uniref:Uncharacterized protein n=1 Tax=Amanita muscaria (strain Koide BX008) TaxID=946122 RepID=A0A0C2WRQ5_AMAMK|nr:hypothetical protein M378DRAFT_163385 [Amanita muscaria Koide BX008]